MTPGEAATKLATLRGLTDKPFGVNFHMFQPGAAEIVDLVIANKDQVRAVSFGRGPDEKMIGALPRRRHPLHPHRRRGEARAKDGRTRLRHGHRPGRRRRRPYRIGADHGAAAASARRGAGAGDRRRGFRRWPRAGRGAGLWRGRHRDGHALPDDRRKPGARRRQGALHQGRHRPDHRFHQGRWHPAAHDPHAIARPYRSARAPSACGCARSKPGWR